jgi:hypothetical protein
MSTKASLSCADCRLGTICDLYFVEYAGNVVSDSLQANDQCLSELFSGFASRNMVEQFSLTVCKVRKSVRGWAWTQVSKELHQTFGNFWTK